MRHGFAQLIVGIVAIVIAIILIVNVVMPTVKGANTTTWSASEVAVYGVVGIVVIAGIILLVLNTFT